MRRLIFALLAVLCLAVASPAAAQLQDYKNTGTIPPCKYNDRQLGKSLGDLPPDIEQYAPGYAEQLRNNRGAACGGKGAPGGGGTTTGANESVEGVPVPPSVGGSGGGSGSGGPGAPGPTTAERIGKPPIPVPTPRSKLANVTSPAITSGPTGPDVPAWVLALIAIVLLGGSALTALFLYGADLSRFTRPLGVAAGEARARTSDRAIELWETVRLGR